MKARQMPMELGRTEINRPHRDRNEFISERLSKGPTGEDRLMEMICERGNLLEALKRVESNKGAPGIDRMTTGQLRGYIRRHWEQIRQALYEGRCADDVAIYVRTPKAAERVKRSVSRFITGRLKLVVNEEKSEVSRPWHSKYLGFRITRYGCRLPASANGRPQ